MINLTPQETVAELDKYIVGQNAAKRAVAVSLRNRWRRLQLQKSMRDEVTPKNIIMIGPTGVGKTEVARRLAKLTGSPFLKVEASKYTEVGYVGRDVESMIRDLMEISINLVKAEKKESIASLVKEKVEDEVLNLLFSSKSHKSKLSEEDDTTESSNSDTREKLRTMLRDGKLDNREIEVPVTADTAQVEVLSNMGIEEMGLNIGDALKSIFPSKKKNKKVKVSDAKTILEQQIFTSMLDMDEVKKEALRRTEESGIIFIDEIDKVTQRSSAGKGGADVSREGVQRDLLPIVEGTTVLTKYGMVKTDYILFIAAGAFSLAKPSDLLPELQGRFPIRVELDNLRKEDFVRILKEPENSLIKQYSALMREDSVELTFTDEAIEALAEMAFDMNQAVENIGARRLHTIMEKLLEEISFNAPDISKGNMVIDKDYVFLKLERVVNDREARTYIL